MGTIDYRAPRTRGGTRGGASPTGRTSVAVGDAEDGAGRAGARPLQDEQLLSWGTPQTDARKLPLIPVSLFYAAKDR